ncbi:MAG: OsmC family protein [Longimicrobiales bacterium]
MPDVIVHLTTATSTRILHARSGTSIESAMAKEYGGAGGAFSSTDLLAAALGSCIATNIGPVADRHGIPLDAFELSVEKELSPQPKRVIRLDVEIRCRAQVSPGVQARLARAAESCTVLRSLDPAMQHSIRFTCPELEVSESSVLLPGSRDR